MILDTGSNYTPTDVLSLAGNAGILDITGVKFVNKVYKYPGNIEILIRSYDPFIVKITINGRYFARIKYLPASSASPSIMEIIRVDTVYIIKYSDCSVLKKTYSSNYEELETISEYTMSAHKSYFSCSKSLTSYIADEMEYGDEAFDIIKNKIIEIYGQL
jgi:hypothetical protein